MYEIEDIYREFRRAQAYKNNRGYRMPKDFTKHFTTKMSGKNQEALELATKFFNTKWQNINIVAYFECGFSLWKNFTYIQFFEPKVMSLYKVRDKNKKREMKISRKEMVDSINFIKKFMASQKVKDIKEYGRLTVGHTKIVVRHYLHGYIDKYTMVHFISNGVVNLTDDDRALIPYIVEHYRECLFELNEIKGK